VATAVRISNHPQPTARRRRQQHRGRPGQRVGDRRQPRLGGGVQRVAPAVAVAAAGAVGGRPQQQVGVLHGVEAQGLGHPQQEGGGVPTQVLVRGVQQAAPVAGRRAVQLETPAGAAQVRKHKAAGTCDGYRSRPRGLCLNLTRDQRLTYVKFGNTRVGASTAVTNSQQWLG
jgi:hypothetical protein